MPSWGTHIYIADKILERIKLDRTSFIIGNVLPDVLAGWIVANPSRVLTYEESHLGVEVDINNKIYLLPDYKRFKVNVKDELTLGYFVHLITDYYFNRYTFENKFVKNSKGEYLGYNGINNKFYSCNKDEARIIKQNEFQMLSDVLIQGVNLDGLDANDSVFNRCIALGYTKEDIDKTLTYISTIKDKKADYSTNMIMFSIDELTKLTDDCIDYIMQEFKHINKFNKG